MPGWFARIVERAGNGGAIENVRRQLESGRDGLARVDMVAERVARKPARQRARAGARRRSSAA